MYSDYFMNGMSVVYFGNNTHTKLMEVYMENLIHGENFLKQSPESPSESMIELLVGFNPLR